VKVYFVLEVGPPSADDEGLGGVKDKGDEAASLGLCLLALNAS